MKHVTRHIIFNYMIPTLYMIVYCVQCFIVLGENDFKTGLIVIIATFIMSLMVEYQTYQNCSHLVYVPYKFHKLYFNIKHSRRFIELMRAKNAKFLTSILITDINIFGIILATFYLIPTTKNYVPKTFTLSILMALIFVPMILITIKIIWLYKIKIIKKKGKKQLSVKTPTTPLQEINEVRHTHRKRSIKNYKSIHNTKIFFKKHNLDFNFITDNMF